MIDSLGAPLNDLARSSAVIPNYTTCYPPYSGAEVSTTSAVAAPGRTTPKAFMFHNHEVIAGASSDLHAGLDTPLGAAEAAD